MLQQIIARRNKKTTFGEYDNFDCFPKVFCIKTAIYRTIPFSKKRRYEIPNRLSVLKIRIHYGNEPAPIMDSEFFCDLQRRHEYVNAIIALHLFLSALAFFDRLNGVVNRCRCICHRRDGCTDSNDCSGNRHYS